MPYIYCAMGTATRRRTRRVGVHGEVEKESAEGGSSTEPSLMGHLPVGEKTAEPERPEEVSHTRLGMHPTTLMPVVPTTRVSERGSVRTRVLAVVALGTATVAGAFSWLIPSLRPSVPERPPAPPAAVGEALERPAAFCRIPEPELTPEQQKVRDALERMAEEQGVGDFVATSVLRNMLIEAHMGGFPRESLEKVKGEVHDRILTGVDRSSLMRVVASDVGVKNLEDVWLRSDKYVNLDGLGRAPDYIKMLEFERDNLDRVKVRLGRSEVSDEDVVLFLVRTLDSDECPDNALAWRASQVVRYHALRGLARGKLGSDEAVDRAFDTVSGSPERRTQAVARDVFGDNEVDRVLSRPYGFVNYGNPPGEIIHFLRTGQVLAFEKWW